MSPRYSARVRESGSSLRTWCICSAPRQSGLLSSFLIGVLVAWLCGCSADVDADITPNKQT